MYAASGAHRPVPVGSLRGIFPFEALSTQAETTDSCALVRSGHAHSLVRLDLISYATGYRLSG